MNCFLMRLCLAPKRYGIIWNNETITIFGHRSFVVHFKDVDLRTFDEKKGLSIDTNTEEIEQIKATEEKHIYEDLLYYLAKSEKSGQQLKQWLAKRLVPKEKIKQYIDYATKKKFIDQTRFAQLFSESKKAKASMPWWLTKKKLIEHGITKEISEQFQYDDEEALFHFYQNRHFGTAKEVTKLQKRLLSRGFSFDKVKKLIDSISEQHNF